MKCWFCNSEIEDDVNFCPSCGNKIGASSSTGKRKKFLLGFIIVTLAVVAIIGFVVFLIKRIDEKKKILSDNEEVSAIADKFSDLDEIVEPPVDSEENMTTVFTYYFDNIGCDYSVLSEEYQRTEQSLGEEIEINYMMKEFDEFLNGWYVCYVFYEGVESLPDGELTKLTFTSVNYDSDDIEKTISRITEIYRDYDEIYMYPFSICSQISSVEQMDLDYTTYQWNQVEDGQYSLLLTVTESELRIEFYPAMDEVSISEILEPIEIRNQGIKRNDMNLFLQGYADQVIEACKTDDQFLGELDEYLSCFQSLVTEYNEVFVDYERVNPAYVSTIFVNDFGWKASEMLFCVDCLFVHMKFNIVVDGKEISEDEYLIVGKIDNEWKICSSPRLILYLV